MIFVTVHATALVTIVTTVAPSVSKQNKEMTVSIQICDHNTVYRLFTESLEGMPPVLLKSVDIVGDRLVSKAAPLVQNKTTNLSENFMSIRCKMDGGKYSNRIQSGSFQHRYMATALHIQHGSGLLVDVWKLAFSSNSDVLVMFSNNRKGQHTTDTAIKIKDKYTKQR